MSHDDINMFILWYIREHFGQSGRWIQLHAALDIAFVLDRLE
jgi:hypothetical protein